jgi:3-dehydroquinate dehydratase/shikimate dehydrogenase
VALVGGTIGEMLETAEIQVKENPFLEFRLDYLENPLAALPRLKKFLSENSVVTAVGTCRRVSNGGRFKGTAAAQVEILQKAIEAGCHLVDVELETAIAVKKPAIDSLREGAAVIMSHHDYEATAGLEILYEKMRRFSPDYYKLVTTAKSLLDNVTMIRFLEQFRDEASLIGICMGDAGIISRILGVRAGSAFTFASASMGEETAPGQIAARTLRETYRIDQVDSGTKVYGVAGSPVRHSLSPLVMNVAFRRETFNGVYLQLQTAKVKELLQLAQELPLQGFSVTMPLKQEVMKHLRTNALTAKVGASNMVVRTQDGKLIGYNTDVTGIIRPLEQRLPLKGARILVLGAGGAARAAVFALRERDADVYVLNRTAETGQKLAREAKGKTMRKDQLAKSQWDVIVNATPVGMTGHKQHSWLEPNEINARYVFDMVYDPIETPLLQIARQKGCLVITGAEMFVNQAAEQFEIWTGKPAPREEMMRIVLHALQQRAAAAPPAVVVKLEKPAKPVKPEVEPKPVKAAKPEVASKPVKAAKPVVAPKPVAKTVAKPVAKPVKSAKSVPAKAPAKKAKR